MKHSIQLTFCLIFLSIATAKGQCPDLFDVFRLDTQEDVDNFVLMYPNCDHVGEIEIGREVTDLSGLKSIRVLEYLYFSDCDKLPNLNGLEGLDTIYHNLGFYDSLGFNNLCGLQNLKYIGRDLRLEETYQLESLTGLESLNHIGDDIEITDNQDLIDIYGIQNVVNVVSGSNVRITANFSLRNCCGVQNLVSNFPQLNFDIANNAENCSNTTEIENATCSFDYVDCLTSKTKNFSYQGIDFFPNPAKEYVTLNGIKHEKIKNARLISLDGKQISVQVTPQRIDFPPGLESGVYILILAIDELILRERIVIN